MRENELLILNVSSKTHFLGSFGILSHSFQQDSFLKSTWLKKKYWDSVNY